MGLAREARLQQRERRVHVVAQLVGGPERRALRPQLDVAGSSNDWSKGCALQLIADPDNFDVDRYMRAVDGLVLTE